jgi:hypothetical protein
MKKILLPFILIDCDGRRRNKMIFLFPLMEIELLLHKLSATSCSLKKTVDKQSENEVHLL